MNSHTCAHIQPVEDENGLHCGRCGLPLIHSDITKSGFTHRIDPPEEKTCRICKKTKPSSEFYTRKTGTIDGLHTSCKSCDLERERQKNKKWHRSTVMIPLDLYRAVEQTKGKQTLREFFLIALRAEVERRVREISRQKLLAASRQKHRAA